MKTTFTEAIKIADIHQARLVKSVEHLQSLFPMTPDKMQDIKEIDLLYIEMLTSRFSKLQDYIGSTLIDLFLDSLAENKLRLSMIDKLHLLEKIGVIEDSFVWIRMREIRNHLAHEYPLAPEITCDHLNKVFLCIPDLLTFLENLKNYQGMSLGKTY